MPKPFDLLAQFAQFGDVRRLSLQEPETLSAFLLHVGDAMERARTDPGLLQGQRVEAMFEALVISLGGFTILKPEDGGRMVANGNFRAPDFRVVLPDGAHWLIEVKNVYEADPLNQRRLLLEKDYHDAMAAYAAATGAEFKLAVFWARWSVWTLVTPARLLAADGTLELDMMRAMRVNELSRLGDRTIASRPPLTLRFEMDPARTAPIADDGVVQATILVARLLYDGGEVIDPVEKELVWAFTQYGQWREKGPRHIVEGDRLVAIEFWWEPEEDSGQGFEMIATLSRMFARYFADHTLKDASVVHLRAPSRPEWFKPLVEVDERRWTLPLWRFSLSPNYDDLGAIGQGDGA